MSRFLSIVLLLAAASISASSGAQERSVDDYMAAIEGAQSEPGANGLGALDYRRAPWSDSTCPASA